MVGASGHQSDAVARRPAAASAVLQAAPCGGLAPKLREHPTGRKLR
jgi:hypothetical protein